MFRQGSLQVGTEYFFIMVWYLASFKQSFIASLSTKEEYMSLSECNWSGRYHLRPLQEFGENAESTTVYEDHQPCIAFATEEGKRNKHANERYHIYREAATNGPVPLRDCPRTDMIAGIFANPLGPQKFSRLKNLMLMAVSPSDTNNNCNGRVLDEECGIGDYLTFVKEL